MAFFTEQMMFAPCLLPYESSGIPKKKTPDPTRLPGRALRGYEAHHSPGR